MSIKSFKTGDKVKWVSDAQTFEGIVLKQVGSDVAVEGLIEEGDEPFIEVSHFSNFHLILPLTFTLSPGKWLQRNGEIAEVFTVRNGYAIVEYSDGDIFKCDDDGKHGSVGESSYDLIAPAPNIYEIWVGIWPDGDCFASNNKPQSDNAHLALRKIALIEGEGLEK